MLLNGVLIGLGWLLGSRYDLVDEYSGWLKVHAHSCNVLGRPGVCWSERCVRRAHRGPVRGMPDDDHDEHREPHQPGLPERPTAVLA